MPFCGEPSRQSRSRSWSKRHGTRCGAARAKALQSCPYSRWRCGIQPLRSSGGTLHFVPCSVHASGCRRVRSERGVAECSVFPLRPAAWPVEAVTQVTTSLSRIAGERHRRCQFGWRNPERVNRLSRAVNHPEDLVRSLRSGRTSGMEVPPPRSAKTKPGSAMGPRIGP